jgi:hypothetical protein
MATRLQLSAVKPKGALGVTLTTDTASQKPRIIVATPGKTLESAGLAVGDVVTAIAVDDKPAMSIDSAVRMCEVMKKVTVGHRMELTIERRSPNTKSPKPDDAVTGQASPTPDSGLTPAHPVLTATSAELEALAAAAQQTLADESKPVKREGADEEDVARKGEEQNVIENLIQNIGGWFSQRLQLGSPHEA